MATPPVVQIDPQILEALPLFADVPMEQLDWLAAEAAEVRLDTGQLLIKQEGPADCFYVILDGAITIYREYGAQEMQLVTHLAGAFLGELPLMLGTPWLASARAVRLTRLLGFSSEIFHRMLTDIPPVARRITRAYALRTQRLEAILNQREKIDALSTLSAGLAHELNNPASAAGRAAGQLAEAICQMQLQTAHLSEKVGAGKIEAMLTYQKAIIEAAANASALTPIRQSEREDQFADWLDAHNVPNSWQLAESLVSAGVVPGQLDKLTGCVAPNLVPDVLTWLSNALATIQLSREIIASTGRISQLVDRVRAYAYLDQAPIQEVDVNAALDSTLSMLNGQIHEQIQVTRDFALDLPRITAYASELNEVWSGLIQNALQAMAEGGRLLIKTGLDHDCVQVEITDSGPGIPLEVQSRIFEPFFSTKGVGGGAGLGLNLAYRIIVDLHQGDIRFSSEPGNTCFYIRIPLQVARPH